MVVLETIYLKERERVGSFYKQNIFLEIFGDFYYNKTKYNIFLEREKIVVIKIKTK